MLRKYLFAGLVIIALVASGATWTLMRSSADQGNPVDKGDGKAAGPLPIAQVILFNSGVGYFERQGEVAGDTKVELSFPTSDVNDLLKSLVLQDTAGGRVQAISYDSQDPVEKILHSFALDLNNNPTYGQILNQARGEKVDVLRQDKPGANPHKVSGTIIGMETRLERLDNSAAGEVEYLNLLAAEGMLAIPLPQVLSARFQNQTLENEFQRALQVLARSHDVQKKSVGLHFSGNGKRTVKVGYVVERPIWKTTYRLVLEPNGKLFMQGWAIVENTSDDDWNSVRMVLVSGKPISYRMDLYQPLYVPRPWVEPELFASLRPPVYGGSLSGELQGAGLPGFPGAALGGIGGGGFGGGLGGFPGPVPSQLSLQRQRIKKLEEKGMKQQEMNKLDYEEMLERKKFMRDVANDVKEKGSAIAGLNFKEGIQSIASSSEVGDYYQYTIDQKISLARQKSAMLPILNQSIDGAKVSIFNEAVHTKYPLLGLRLKNNSSKPLTQGPITVYDGGSYAGDTRILDLEPKEERLLSYALDQGTEVKTTVATHPAPEMTLNIGGNNLTALYTLRQTKTYTIKNRGTHDRTVIIEHPIRGDWKLIDPKKPNERSRDVYRFQIDVKAGQTVKQEVTEDQSRTDPIGLVQHKDAPPFYAIADGIQIKPEVKNTGGKLLSLNINKGVLDATYKERESKTYFIQNESDRDHVFTVDHIVRKEWKRLAADGKNQEGPTVYQFKLEVKSKGTAHQEVVEERVYEDKSQVVSKLSDDLLRRFIAEQVLTGRVKDALQQVVDKQAKLLEAQQELAGMKQALSVLTQDQARVRDSLKVIPQTSEHYKEFLQKFVAQEKQIEESQRQIRAQEAQVQKLQKEYEVYVTGLTIQ
jgi:hypothetical protein